MYISAEKDSAPLYTTPRFIMFKEEKMINGKLCWRSTPNSEFRPYTQEQLSIMVVELQEQNHRMSWALTPEHQRR